MLPYVVGTRGGEGVHHGQLRGNPRALSQRFDLRDVSPEASMDGAALVANQNSAIHRRPARVGRKTIRAYLMSKGGKVDYAKGKKEKKWRKFF